MMLRVSHLTRYEYDREVEFSPHILYLRPRESALQRLSHHRLLIQPEARICHVIDPHDNNSTWVHFSARAATLELRSEFELSSELTNPFDFLIAPDAIPFPFRYEPALAFALSPYLAPPFGTTLTQLQMWLDENFRERPGETVPFLSALNTLIYRSLRYVRREEPGIQPSAVTLALGGGACRDYAVLFVELARMLGIAARFVSGYLFAPSDKNDRSAGAMHAWVEVYLPGAGWRGLDPTHGFWCDENFIPVAHAAQADSVNPIQGTTFAAGTVSARLFIDVLVERIDEAAPAPFAPLTVPFAAG